MNHKNGELYKELTCTRPVAHTHNPSTLELKARGLQVQGQLCLHIEFEANLVYMRLCFKNLRQKKRND